MSSGKERTYTIQGPDGSSMIELTLEEMHEYTECLKSRSLTNQMISFIGGLITCMAVPVKAQTPFMYYAKKGMAGTVAVSILSIFTTLGNVVSCGPILQQLLISKLKSPTKPETEVEEKETTHPKELLDFTPSISSDDFSSPLNFSRDSDSSTTNFDKLEPPQELKEKAAAPKKRVTYDELWKLHKENEQKRWKAKDGSSEGIGTEDNMESEPRLEKKKIRTNKYGDPLD